MVMEQPVPPAKRRRSPSPPARHGQPSKAPHKGKGREQHRPLRDLFGFQEIFLRILSFLPATDLANVQSVNRHWSRMTLDPQLWRRLYLSRYPHPHASRLIYRQPPGSGQEADSSTPTRPRRRISRLPSRAFPPPSPSRTPTRSSVNNDEPGSSTPVAADERHGEVGWGIRNDGVDWKMMLRLETNWVNGNALSETTLSLPPSPSPTISSDRPEESRSATPPVQSQQHIALSPSFIFTSDPMSPLVQVHRALPIAAEAAPRAGTTSVPLGIIPPPPGWSSPHRPDNITCICTDQSVSLPHSDDTVSPAHKLTLPARLSVFYQSGGFVVLHVRSEDSRLIWKREAVHPTSSRPRSLRRRNVFVPDSGDPVVLASLHYPVLVACSLSFHVSAYLVVPTTTDDPSRPLHLSTMHSDVSFHPAALTLFPDDHIVDENTFTLHQLHQLPGTRHLRASLTYCTPLYPSSWTVAVQEFTIDLNKDFSDGTAERRECFTVLASDDDMQDGLVWPRRIKPIVGVKGRRAVGVGADGRWCVLAGNDNQIQVYALPSLQQPWSISDFSDDIRKPTSSTIIHSHTLLAHSSAVTSLSLLAGRCVSGARDGRVLVWELDGDDHDMSADGKRGRTVGYVEVKQGGRRKWYGASGPPPPPLFDSTVSTTKSDNVEGLDLPHPASISSAARSLFLPRPPDEMRPRNDRPPPIRQLIFDEEKIVGLVRVEDAGSSLRGGGEMMKVWSFNS